MLGALTAMRVNADDDDEIAEFDELEIFFEFNATDLDLGLQGFLDAPAWKELKARGPDGEIFEVEGDGVLGDLGITEFDFEGAEPPLVDDPDTATDEEIAAAVQAFLDRFPEGEYVFRGETVDGRELHGVAELTHNLLDAPEFDLSAFPTIIWVTDPDAVECEIVVEADVITIENGEEEERTFVNTAIMPAAANMFTASAEFLDMLDVLESDGAEVEAKVELICIEESGNKTSSEEELEED
jgi:hypothetical protein